MRKARFAAGASITLAAFLCGVPFVSDRNTAVGTILDIADFICYGTHTSGGGSDPSGIGATAGEHEHPPGLYMPMFSTPPKGGAVYNGPPLDQC